LNFAYPFNHEWRERHEHDNDQESSYLGIAR